MPHLSPAMAAMVRTEATMERWVMKVDRRQNGVPNTQFLKLVKYIEGEFGQEDDSHSL